MFKIAIFDLDGTLLDTVRDLGTATNYALSKCGYPERPIEDYYTLCGRGIYNMFRGAVPEGEATEDNVKKMAGLFIEHYDKHKCDFTRPYPGITEMLNRITAAGILPAVASNKYQDGAEKLIKHYFGEYGFLKILGQREGQPIKPDPEIVYQVMAALPGTRKEEVVYIGDSDVDMQTGANAGVKTIGVSWGFRSREELEGGKPFRIADSAWELADFILSAK
ncbi:MAG: HAD family hydrolase [Candidatus Cryptobacteroides sp.]|nr:HAD family hydrolase [Bacteroidales bacterium]